MMKKLILTLLITVLASCSPFNKDRALDYEKELNAIIIEIEDYNTGTYDRDEIDEYLIQHVRKMDIDLIVKNDRNTNPYYSGFVEEKDSLIILIHRAQTLFEKEKRLLYDYSKKPRNYGNDKIVGASYSIFQLNDRWYYSEVGFD